MITLPAQFSRSWLVPIIVILVSALFQATDLVTTLRFEPEAIFQGEWWRMITGNLVHLTWTHLWLNAAGMLMVWYFFSDDYSPPQWSLLIFVCGLGVSTGLLLLDDMKWYVGLSGLLHGLFIAGALRVWRDERLFASLLLAIFAGKLCYEQLIGSMPGTSDLAGGPVVVNSHLYGAISGALCGLVMLLTRLRKRTLSGQAR